MRLRNWIPVLALSVVAVAIVAVTTLVLAMRDMVRSSTRIMGDLETVQNVDGVALDLLRHRRQQLGWLDTLDPDRLAEAASREHDVLRGIRKIGTTTVQDRGALDLARADVQTYFREADAVPSASSPAMAYRTASMAFTRAQDSLEALTVGAATRATNAKQDAQNFESFIGGTATGVAGLIVLVAIVISTVVRRALIRPVEALLRSIESFQQRGTMPTHRLGGEFGEIERALTEMATTIERQRSSQLEFIASVAHDLRNPLSSMKSYCWMGRRGTPLPAEEKIRKAFSVIDHQVDRLNQQIGELLDRSRVEAGAFELRRSPTNLSEILREVGVLFDGVAPGRIELDVPPALSVLADSTKLQQAVTNLVSNGIKYSPEGGKVVVAARREGDEVRLEVRDHGIGISHDDLAQIFEPFRRSDRALEMNIPGVGLGLSAMRRIVEAHGGRVEVQSEIGRGSTFRVYLPALPSEGDVASLTV